MAEVSAYTTMLADKRTSITIEFDDFEYIRLSSLDNCVLSASIVFMC
jgi:hypothetical protein